MMRTVGSHRGVPLALVLLLAAQVGAAAPESRVVVHPEETVGPSNQRVGGVAWNAGELRLVTGSTDPADPCREGAFCPPGVRTDAHLDVIGADPDGTLDFGPLESRMEQILALGADPVLGLFYTPARMSRAPEGCAAFPGCDPTRWAPEDLDAWEGLVEAVARRAAEIALAHAAEEGTDPPPLQFETWNEPDFPVFWQDTPAAFLDMAMRSHRAVSKVDGEFPELDLRVGGPAPIFPDPAYLLPYFLRLRIEGLPLHFVSWHHYGNSPSPGPDGLEPRESPEPLRSRSGVRNPLGHPGGYTVGTHLVRSWTTASFAGTSTDPEILVTEWNVSAGGHDVRHDTHEGATFAAASMIEMERVGLDGAFYYRAVEERARTRPGDWGLVDPDGERKPPWWVFFAWQETKGDLVAIEGDDPSGGLWARATRSGGGLHVLFANYSASAPRERDVVLALAGPCAAVSASLRRLDADSSDLEAAESVSFEYGTASVTLAPQSVGWLEAELTCPASADRG